MEGKFFAPRLLRDVLDPTTGSILSRRTGELRASLAAADPSVGKMLRELAAQAYYSSALAVSTDRMLAFSRPAKHGRLALPSVGGEDGAEAKKRPRVGAVLVPKSSGVVNEVRKIDNNEAIREAKLEEKRRKNRLSAARSNVKRKERVLAQERELCLLKDRVSALRVVEDRLRMENGLLRGAEGVAKP